MDKDKAGKKYTEYGYFDIAYENNEDLSIERIFVDEDKRGNQYFFDIMEKAILHIKEN